MQTVSNKPAAVADESHGAAHLAPSSQLHLPHRFRSRTAAKYLSISVSHFFALVKEHRLPPPLKCGRQSFWVPTELIAAFDAYVASRQRSA
jgi:predicted DNA-binding transcriptional regulator AlpA